MVRSLVLIVLLAGGTAAEGAGVQPLYAKLSATRWRVGVLSETPLDPEGTQRRVLRTAAELTIRYGFDWFRPIGEPKEPVEGPLSPDPAPGAGRRLRWGERCKDGWRFATAPAELCGDAPSPKVGFQASTQVVMGHGPTPRTGEAVDARSLLKGH
jgi:hypothetical protein